ncbi:MAG: DNA cytosine methyltransferase [Dysgonamonadaceae bacterium]|jgi:DNA (cytosine-5)-methyltransferase 1|nr:DNA cytosine methyltransferase [Dysgonamonadaceae bacterium]
MTHASLFSGRGTWDIVAQELGFENKFNCEIDAWLRNKLKRISPDAKQYSDVKTCIPYCTVSVLSASFPCQDISISNQTGVAGIHGTKSGLWSEVKRVATITQPKYIVLENSSQLVKKGLETVLSDLSEIGYDAEWHCLQGRDFGFPTRRERIFIIAYPSGNRRRVWVFRPPGTYKLSRTWTPTEAYLRVVDSRANGYRDTGAIQRGDVVHNFRREIHAFGNAVMPVIVEHLFKCILDDYKYYYDL